MSKSNITYLKYPPLPGYIGEAWNPIVGCTHSGMAGCDHCWARELHNMRFSAWQNGAQMPAQYHYPFAEIQVIEARFAEPASWKAPRLVMVCPQSDLFHPDLSSETIQRVLRVIVEHPQHQFFVLTKRTERARIELQNAAQMGDSQPSTDILSRNGGSPLFANLGILASVSCQDDANKLLPYLALNVGWRGVSYEPALGMVDFSAVEWNLDYRLDALTGELLHRPSGDLFNHLPGLDLIIAGCESGRHWRPDNIAWYRSVRDQCRAAGVAFYLKQMQGTSRVDERPLLDGRQHLEWPDPNGSEVTA